jgi:GNAT superfamily N-acetyltransferase
MVAEHHQGKGHGIDALRFIERRCRQIGRRRIILSAVDGAGAAIPFYEKQGYKKTGNIVDGEIEMAKLIKQS